MDGSATEPLLEKRHHHHQRESFVKEFGAESKRLWKLSGPAIFTYICQYSLGALTQTFAGQVGELELAAVSVENSVIAGLVFGAMLMRVELRKMGKVVCVTGASGYIASWLVKLLLEHGYTVKGTVRNLSDPRKVAHLKALEGADERLHLYEADLLEEGSFHSVVDGCEGVFHTASPVFISVSDPQTELLDPAVKGTLNVLKSCKNTSTVKRVVVTSSMASVMFNYNPLGPDVTIDETWFSDPIFCEEKKEWYALSKTLAETATWKFVEENGLDLVMLHPGFVIGPLLQPTLNLTSEAVVNLIKQGKELLPKGIYRYVDVRDVALAHILAFENPSASGRYCLVGRVAYSFEALNILSRIFPSLKLPPYDTENRPAEPPFQVSQEKAKSLGINFMPLEVSLKDTVESLKEKNFITF